MSLALFEALRHNLPHVPGTLPPLDVDQGRSFPLAATMQMDTLSKREFLVMRNETARLDRLDPFLRFALSRGGDGGAGEGSMEECT